ncbi:MAG: CBS domain-containing protein [Tannerella sp.]|nr:CBS domain-containing protein [Tannerella sp.]
MLLQSAICEQPAAPAILALACILILLILLYLISSGERALFSLSPDEMSDLREENSVRRQLIWQLSDQPQRTFLALTMARSLIHAGCIVSGIYAADVLSGRTLPLPWICLYATLGWMILGYLSGRLIPQWIVRERALHVIQSLAPFLGAVDRILQPLTKPILSPSMSYNRKKTSAGEPAMISKDPMDEKEMLDEIIHFYNKRVDEIMIPRLDMVMVDVKCHFEELMKVILHTGFSRIPVYSESEDNVKGVLYAKDLLPVISRQDTFEWQSLIRPAYFVPETKKIDHLLEEFRTNKMHIAIVVDEFGCTSGIVTLEDVIEEIVGEIADEYDDDDEKRFFRLPDKSYIFEGKIQLNDFFRETDIDPDHFGKMTEDIETLAGLLLKIKGTLPKRRDTIEYRNFRFQVLEANERRVLKIKFSVIDRAAEKKE